MSDELLHRISEQLDALDKSVGKLQHDLDVLRQVTLPTLFWRSTQQSEYLDMLVDRLGLDRGWLPPTRGWAASPDFLCILAYHLLNERADVAVECGSGTSTLVIARCLQLMDHGQLLSLEHNANHAKRTNELLAERKLEKFATVLHAPLKTIKLNDVNFEWYSLDNLPDVSISCLVVDGPPFVDDPLVRYPAGPMLFKRLADKAVVFVDDLNRPGERHCFDRWRKDHPDLVASIENAEKGCGVLRREM